MLRSDISVTLTLGPFIGGFTGALRLKMNFSFWTTTYGFDDNGVILSANATTTAYIDPGSPLVVLIVRAEGNRVQQSFVAVEFRTNETKVIPVVVPCRPAS